MLRTEKVYKVWWTCDNCSKSMLDSWSAGEYESYNESYKIPRTFEGWHLTEILGKMRAFCSESCRHAFVDTLFKSIKEEADAKVRR